ncbi:hypothetical protein ES702_00338 [subsurface metagenome]
MCKIPKDSDKKGGDFIAKYRPKSSFISKDPEKRAKSLANLKRGKKPGTLQKIKYDKKKIQDISIIEFATDKDYLGLFFKERPAQEVILRVLYGLPLNEKQLEIFRILTKNKGKYIPGQVKNEAVLALGARSGKSFLASICALYEATRGTWKEYLAKDEYVYIVIVATRELQARKIIQENCLRMLENSPVLKRWVKKSTDLEITLKNHVKIISGPCNSTALRGLPIAILILDELAFYRIEGPKADETIFNSLRPRQAQFPDNKLFMISTAGAKQGLFFQFFNEGFKIQDRLTAQASTSYVNPLIPKAFLDKEKARDVDNYAREFEALFSEKLESFFTYEMIQKPFTLAGDIPYKAGNRYNLAFDQSGLSGKDRFACAISHSEKENVLIDCVRSWVTKDLDKILTEVKMLAIQYHLRKCLVDKYAVGYVRNAFNKINIEIEIRPNLAEVFVVLKSLILQDRVMLPDRADLKNGMKNCIAIYNKSNQLTIFHERGPEGHADEIDAVASVAFGTVKKLGGKRPSVRLIDSRPGKEKGRNWKKVLGNDWDEDDDSNLLTI